MACVGMCKDVWGCFGLCKDELGSGDALGCDGMSGDMWRFVRLSEDAGMC